MTSIDQRHGGNRLRQGLSWTLSFRSTMRKKHRIVRPPTPPPTCEERIHYPIFNPHDPRHNPAAASPLWLHSEHTFFEDSSDTQNPSRWMQSLPQRSLRKARSGILAIRSGIQRRPPPLGQGQRHNIPGLWMSPESNRRPLDSYGISFPSTISEASTENEHEFGTDLYRTRRNASSTWDLELARRYVNERPAHTPTHGVPPEWAIRLVGETLNGSDEEGPVSKVPQQPCKRPAITWDDANLNRVPSRPTSSGSVSSTTSTSFKVSSLSHIIDVNGALEALCQLDQPTADSRESVDTADAFVPAKSQNSTESALETPEPRDSTESNTKQIMVDTKEPGDPIESNAERASMFDFVIDCVVDIEDEAAELRDSNERNAERPPPVDPVDTGEEPRISFEASVAELPMENGSSVISSALEHTSPMEEPGAAGSSFGQGTSRNSTCYSEGDSSTILTSWSNLTPVDYDDLLSLPSLNLGDEYFYGGGKTGGYHPDRGSNPVKAEPMIIRDGRIDSDFGLDRSQSFHTQHVPELIGPGGPFLAPSSRPINPFRRERGSSSDSSDDCFLT